MSRTAVPVNQSVRIAAALLVIAALATTVGVADASGALHSHAKSVVVSTFKSAKFGTILSDGRTLYILRPNASACTGTCLKFWIPVLLPKGVTKATAGIDVSAAKLGTKNVAGDRQVTYGGKTLYWFIEDKAPGQVKGNVTDTWGKWSDVVLVKPAKAPPTTTTGPPKTTTTTSPPKTTTTIANPPTTTTVPKTTTTSPGGGGIGF